MKAIEKDFNSTITMIRYNYSIKKIKALLLIIISSSTLWAQTLKYEDIINDLNRVPAKQLYYRFFQFQKQDPHFANTYVQLGNASEQIFRELDPLRNFNQANYWINNATLYYGLFEVYLKPNDVRRYRDFYANFPIETPGRRLENEDVVQYVQGRLTFCRTLKDSLALIYSTLEKSKDHYNNCVRIFNEINNTYDNLNEALLQTDQNFLSLISNLESEYKATIDEFGRYQQFISAFPIGSYNQKFEPIPIETFRLDGLTNSDFLKDEFTIWDYGKWVEDFRKTYNTDIVGLRNEIASIQKTFNDNRRRLSIIQTVDEDEKFKSYDELFMFRLGKYDNSSLIRELFRYLNSRQDFLVLGKSPLNSPNDSSTTLINRKLRYYHSLAVQKNSTGEFLEEFNSSITTERVKRFKDFFTQQYQGEQGLKQFYTTEGNYLNTTLNQWFDNLKTFFENENAYQRSKGMATAARGVSMPLYAINSNVDDISKYNHITQAMTYNLGIPTFASGYISRQGRKPMAFIAKISDGQKVDWIREIGAKGGAILPNGDSADLLNGFDGGSIAVVSGKSELVYRNTLVRLDNTGKEVLNKQLPFADKPIFLGFDEITQLSMIAFGFKDNDTLSYYSSITVCQTDSVGNLNWRLPLNIQGNVVSIIRSGDDNLLFANYKSYNINNSRKDSDNWAMVMVKIGNNGEVKSITPFSSSGNIHFTRVFPISNDEISLIGYSDVLGSSIGNLAYLVVNPDGKVIFKNF